MAGIRMNGIQESSPYSAAAFASDSGPPLPSIQNCAIECANAPRPAATPDAKKIQPIAFSGCRVAISTPTPAKTSAIAQMKLSSRSMPGPPADRIELTIISAGASTARPQARRTVARLLMV